MTTGGPPKYIWAMTGEPKVGPEASTGQPGTVFPQLVEDFIHLKRRHDRFDEDRGPDRTPRNAQVFLREYEDVVPQPRFQMTLHFWKIETRTLALGEERASVVEEKQTKIRQ